MREDLPATKPAPTPPEFHAEPDRLLKPRDAAAMLSISVRQLWRISGLGVIPRVNMASTRGTRFRLSDLRRVMAAGSSPSPQAPATEAAAAPAGKGA
ncbi:MAG TPA: hypothetical protein PKE29_13440 [Phycisphaerales bacterium]|nr:hypothetical protein [Phycisphaerales bacterium]